jgi:hypothetical protein
MRPAALLRHKGAANIQIGGNRNRACAQALQAREPEERRGSVPSELDLRHFRILLAFLFAVLFWATYNNFQMVSGTSGPPLTAQVIVLA